MRVFVFLVILLFVMGCAQETVVEPVIDEKTSASPEWEGDKMKVLMIIAPKDFRDEELAHPKEVLENAGIEVDVASITTDEATGMLGMKVTPDVAVKDVNIADYEYVIVVGGAGSPALMDYPEVLSAVKAAKNKAAICLAPMVLAKAGVLQGKKATVYKTPESLTALQQGGAEYVEEDVVVDGTTVTADGPGSAKKFGNKLVEMIK